MCKFFNDTKLESWLCELLWFIHEILSENCLPLWHHVNSIINLNILQLFVLSFTVVGFRVCFTWRLATLIRYFVCFEMLLLNVSWCLRRTYVRNVWGSFLIREIKNYLICPRYQFSFVLIYCYSSWHYVRKMFKGICDKNYFILFVLALFVWLSLQFD